MYYINLPGQDAPEIVVYKQLKEQKSEWGNLPERFGVGAGTLLADLDDIITDPDHHKWNRKLGDKVRKSHISSVWEIMAREWVKEFLTQEEKEIIYKSIIEILDHE